MPLTHLELYNFKSYKGHQTIGPFTSFTSVIGPNGAGKSNLMDAISFVLGVKSRELRSSQLRDLVYRGRRIPRGGGEGGVDASYVTGDGSGPIEPDAEAEVEGEEEGEDERQGEEKKAWVMAVFVDKDGKEWKFKRTTSTSGTSSYTLNGVATSYTAYTAFLAKHSILVRARNFLVFQGDVELVASQSPGALTRLIEQISGSLELKPLYETHLASLNSATERANENFGKRRGVNGEIRVFREQKKEVEEFEGVVAKRDELTLRRHLHTLFHIEDSLDTATHTIRTLATSLPPLLSALKEKEETLEEKRREEARVRGVFGKKERGVKKGERGLEGKKPTLITLTTQITHSTGKLRRAQTNKEQLLVEVEKFERALEERRKELGGVRKDAEEAQEKARKASAHNVSLSEESLEEYRKLKSASQKHAITERQALSTLSLQMKADKRGLAQIKDKYEQFEERKKKLSEESASVGERRAELEAKVRDYQGELEKTRQELDNQTSEKNRVSQLTTELNEKLQDVLNKLLQAGMDQRESEREIKLKEVLGGLQRVFPGVRGRVVELCKPTQRKYEAAISVVLGRNIDAIVVDEEKTAIDCIEYMRTQRAGQATFIPLDTIQVKPINDKFRSFTRGARLAVDVIQYEPAVERAIHHACGNALVCDTMEVARWVCYDKGQEVKAVTLEGTVIHKSGLITGGRSTHGNGKKWEEKDLQGLQRVRDNLMGQLHDLQKSKPRGNSEENLIAEITRIESALTVARDDLSACKLRLNGIKEELKHVTSELKETSTALKKAQTAFDSLQEKINELASVVNAAEDQVFAAFCQKIGVENIREYEERQLKVAQEESEARQRFDTMIARLTHQIQFDEEQLQNVQQRLANLEKTIANEQESGAKLEAEKVAVEQEIEEAERALATLQEERDALKEELEEHAKEVDVAKKAAAKATKAYDQALKEIASRNDEIEKLGLERSALYRKCRLEDIKIPLLEGHLKNVPMEENLRNEVAMDVDEDDDGTQRPKKIPDYGIEVDFDALTDEEREDGSSAITAKLDEEISKLSAEIERMAPNMKAIDRLEDVEAKLLETEKEAEKARKETKTAREQFNEVKKRRCELFNKAYNHIAERIDQVYKDLTKGKAAPMGGVAYLSLEDSEEPYLAGVKYHAMPPMKRFRDMEQLSGGEKTVAALALLFAIHSYQPSPFFVLDEVDAALDNTNVAKIANYIRSRASDDFQFIVISLKGSLYERSKSLVGIYRDQDLNSSRTLTLDLTQYDD